MSKKKKLPGVSDGSVAEVPGEEAEALTGGEPATAFDTSDDEPEDAEIEIDAEPPHQSAEDDDARNMTAEAALTVPAIGDRVRYSEIRDGMLFDLLGRVLHADGDVLTLDLPAATGSPARVVAASRYSQATRAGWWV